jgi:hypothetical protein
MGPLWRPRYRRKNKYKRILKEQSFRIWIEFMWFGMVQWWAHVKNIMKLSVPQKNGTS